MDEEHDLYISEKTIRGYKVKTIMTRKQYGNIKKGTDHADGMNYEYIQQYIRRNANELLHDTSKRHAINVLTAVGWRAGKVFSGVDMDFYNPALYYNDDDELTVVYGVQIVEL